MTAAYRSHVAKDVDTPPGYRVFGRPRAFDCECPACGHVVLVGLGRGRVRGTYWDPLTSRLHCPGCQRTWIVGLALWPATPHGTGLPADAVPSPAQLAQLRQHTGSLVQAARKGGRQSCANLAPVCTCPLWGLETGRSAGLRSGLDPQCPRHGAGGSEPDPGQD